MSLLDRRIGLLFAAFLLLLVLAFGRALYFGTVRGGALTRVAATQQVAVDVVPARRGTITDRNGDELAVSEQSATVIANPYLIRKASPARIAGKLAPLVHMGADAVLRAITKPDSGYVIVARQVPGVDADRIKALGINGISQEPSEHRTYPRGLLAGQVLGIVGRDDNGTTVGREGLEYSRNRVLSGSAGKVRTLRDALGQPLQVTDLKQARPGAKVQLTLDAAIQQHAESVLAGIGEKYRPKSATAVVMDPRTNEVLAMANWPRVDPNDPAGAPAEARQNRAVGYTYEPGSTFKPFTVAGALEDHTTTPSTVYDLAPTITVADRTIHDAEDRGPEALTTAQILAKSSNVGAITIGLAQGRVRFDHWIRAFGFGKPTGIDLPGEERGIQPKVSQYSGSSMGNLPIGQGEAVTPLQIATAYSALANGGILRRPQIVKDVGGVPVPRPRGHRVISEQVSAEIRQMLEGVFAPGGTAAEVSIPGYQLAGKTGTANKVDPVTHEYSSTNYVASFVGFAPAAKPKLLVSVMVDQPQGAIYGGVVAAPAFGDIAQFALQYLQIPPK
ncbi:penicillin-binding protein 2 [Paraconexibacter antarcticus]|uniref:Penicillin-binding protein 2 n=1 Tax=Paraconexibacter antarcticus TaxID=2949664 RepID=A0ABY5DQ27_9ACTN|nr:penicillin-binding protein 2 [Paraconexibacter antarcticus]UTI63172.1 penicillin-binding protein 2 [Paraconexibacter antarcticus]